MIIWKLQRKLRNLEVILFSLASTKWISIALLEETISSQLPTFCYHCLMITISHSYLTHNASKSRTQRNWRVNLYSCPNRSISTQSNNSPDTCAIWTFCLKERSKTKVLETLKAHFMRVLGSYAAM